MKKIYLHIEKVGSHNLSKSFVLLVYIAIISFLAGHHEPWADEYKVWNMTFSMSLGELFESMRVEGHFCLWHLCVLPWVKLFGMDYHAIFVASITLMSLAVFLLLFKVEFPFSGKMFIIFSAPFLYHFPVIARCYALIPPICIALAAVYQKKKSPYLYCLLIGLLAHTHAYMEGLVAILWVLFVYRYVIEIWNKERKRAKKNLLASIITVVMVFLAFIQIAGSVVDASNGVGPAFKSAINDYYWVSYFFSYHRVKIFNTLKIQLNALIPNLDLSVTLFIYCTILFLLRDFMFKNKSMTRKDLNWIIAVGSIWQIIFATNIYDMSFQRVYLLCIPIFLTVGMYFSKNCTKHSICIVALFWLINTPCQYVMAKDITQEYCFDARCASEIDSHLPENAKVLTTGEVSSIRLLRRNFIHISEPVDSLPLSIGSIVTKGSFSYSDTLYLITTHPFISDSTFNVSPIYCGIEGNGEISGIQYEQPFTLYSIIQDEKSH